MISTIARMRMSFSLFGSVVSPLIDPREWACPARGSPLQHPCHLLSAPSHRLESYRLAATRSGAPRRAPLRVAAKRGRRSPALKAQAAAFASAGKRLRILAPAAAAVRRLPRQMHDVQTRQLPIGA